MDLGLYMHCGNMGHLTRSCPHQPTHQNPGLEGRAMLLVNNALQAKMPKKELAVFLPPREFSA